MSEELITQTTPLETLSAELAAAPWVALDTEFMRERTYYAQLCLVQVATPQRVACVDALALPSLEPLLAALQRPTLLKVLHAARQDLEVMGDQQAAGGRAHRAAASATTSGRARAHAALPAPVFDTQVAAALLGSSDQIGYGALVEQVVGVQLPKLHTRTDWAARPLSSDQLRYACDDVRYLRDVYRHLDQELVRRGRRAWLDEECAQLTDPRLYGNDPREAWRRLRAGQSLPACGQVILRGLAAWREREAQQRNLPRGWLVKDAVLVEIARRAPRDLDELTSVADVHAATVRNFGAAILAEIERGSAETPVALWPPADRLDDAQLALYKTLAARVQECAAREQINATLIATRQGLQELIRTSAGPLLRGWRRTLIGAELLALRDAART